jgi:hypothetical protein
MKHRVSGYRTSTHSIRCDDTVWTRARSRANKEGVSMNHVLSEILEGYADHKIDLPQVTIDKSFAPRAVVAEPVAVE